MSKKITLLVASILLVGYVAQASELNFTDATTTRFGNNDPISFEERGIEFFVFQNGDFDFNTRPENSQGDFFFKSAGRRITTKSKNPTNYGVLIERDNFGRVRRIGNTFINYDIDNRVTRIGSIFMKYDRFLLTQIGGLHIIYNRFGDIVDTVGSIKGVRNIGFTSSYYGTTCNYHNTYYNTQNNDYSYNNNNESYYYYRTDGTKALVERKK